MTVGKFILVVVFRDDERRTVHPCDSSCYNAATTALSSTTLTTIAGNGNSGLLQSNSIKLLAAYRENYSSCPRPSSYPDPGTILPSVVDEFDLSPDATEWATEWLNDTGTVALLLEP